MDLGRGPCEPFPMAKKVQKSRGVGRVSKPQKPQAAIKPRRAGGDDNDRRVYEPLPSLKAWFKLAKVRAWQVAEAIGIPESHLSNIIRGRRPYLRPHLEDIAAFLSSKLGRRITPDMLLNDPADPNLARLAAEVDPRHKERAANALEAFRRDQ